jgi:hypothetical protein
MPWRSRDIADLATFPRGNAIVRERWQAYAHYRHLKRMATPAKVRFLFCALPLSLQLMFTLMALTKHMDTYLLTP